MPQCARCEGELASKSGGILEKLGLASHDGYECPVCGTLLCSDCYKRRTLELAGSAHEGCPTCDGTLEKR